MVKLIRTDQAIDDLGTIGNYIAQQSEQFAKITVKRLYERTAILRKFPQSRRVVPEKNQETLRELIEGNYRIIYETSSDELIYILTVHHSARELKL